MRLNRDGAGAEPSSASSLTTPERVGADVEAPELVLSRRSYAVVGSTAAQLRRAVALLGPRRHGVVHAAYVDWELRWSLSITSDPDGFRAALVHVVVEAEVTTPRWRPTRSAGPELVARWREVLDAIETHERGHIAIALEAGRGVRAVLERLAGFASHDALRCAAEARVLGVVEAFRLRERSYDAATRHGAAQGVPPDFI